MKKCNFAKISLLILALSLCFGAVFAMSANAADAEATKPEILAQNVMYTDQFCLMYAVDAAAAPVTLNVYRSVPDAETPVDNSYTVSKLTSGEESGLKRDAYIFTVQGVGATDFLDEFYVQAIDANGNKSDLKRYSVAEYLYARLASGKANEVQTEFYNYTLKFAETAQLLFSDEGETPDLVTSYRYVTVNGGTVDDYINEAGVYPIGKTITLRAPGAISSTWNVTTTAKDGTVKTSTVTDKFVVTDAVKTEFELVSKKEYRSQVITFEDKNVGESDKIFSQNDMTGTKSYVYEEGHGMVLKISMEKGGIFARDTYDTTIVSKAEATAFEFSFDMKLDFPNYNVAQRQMILPSVQIVSGSSVSKLTRLYMGHNRNQSYFSLINPSTGKDVQAVKDIDYTDWFHVRIVYYKGDANQYVYFNGSDTPYVISAADNKGNGSYDGDITKICRIDFTEENNTVKTDIYIDNLFYGFTTDTLPAAE